MALSCCGVPWRLLVKSLDFQLAFSFRTSMLLKTTLGFVLFHLEASDVLVALLIALLILSCSDTFSSSLPLRVKLYFSFFFSLFEHIHKCPKQQLLPVLTCNLTSCVPLSLLLFLFHFERYFVVSGSFL